MSENKDKDAVKGSKEELLKKLKTMSLDELTEYGVLIKFLNNIINVCGVLTILIMLFNPTIGMLIGCGLLLYFLASAGSNTTMLRSEVKKLIEAKDK